MIIKENEFDVPKNIQDYKKRPIAKSIFENISHIINSCANEERDLGSFYYAVHVKLDFSNISENYKKNINKKFLGLMWARFKKDGFCISPENLSNIERDISINTA